MYIPKFSHRTDWLVRSKMTATPNRLSVGPVVLEKRFGLGSDGFLKNRILNKPAAWVSTEEIMFWPLIWIDCWYNISIEVADMMIVVQK